MPLRSLCPCVSWSSTFYSTVTLCVDWPLVEVAGARCLSTRRTEAQRPRSRRAAEFGFSVPLRSLRLCVSWSSTSTRRLRSAGIGCWSRSPALDLSQQDTQRRRGHGVAGPLSVNSLCRCALRASVCLVRRRSARRLRSAGISRWSRSPALDLSQQDTRWRRGHGAAEFGFSVGSVWPRERHRVVWIRTGFV